MTIHEYLEQNLLLLTVSPIIEHFQLITRRELEAEGYLRIRAKLIDESLLAISIYCQIKEDIIHLIDYRFHWQDKHEKLNLRWDNARHHPEIETFPQHLHIREEEKVTESTGIDLWEILRVLELELKETK